MSLEDKLLQTNKESPDITWNNAWRLVVDADLEAGRAPIDELDAALRLDDGDGSVDILGDDVAPVQHAARHVLSASWVTLHHLVRWLEAGIGDFSNAELLMVGFLNWNSVYNDRWCEPIESSLTPPQHPKRVNVHGRCPNSNITPQALKLHNP